MARDCRSPRRKAPLGFSEEENCCTYRCEMPRQPPFIEWNAPGSAGKRSEGFAAARRSYSPSPIIASLPPFRTMACHATLRLKLELRSVILITVLLIDIVEFVSEPCAEQLCSRCIDARSHRTRKAAVCISHLPIYMAAGFGCRREERTAELSVNSGGHGIIEVLRAARRQASQEQKANSCLLEKCNCHASL